MNRRNRRHRPSRVKPLADMRAERKKATKHRRLMKRRTNR